MFILAFIYDSREARCERQTGDFLLVPFHLERGSSFAIYREGLLKRKWLVRLTPLDQAE